MIDVSELELRILANLEEAGEENVPALLNTILLNADEESAYLDSYLKALQNLVTKDHVRLSTSRGSDRRLADLSIANSLREIEGQRGELIFDASEKLWRDKSRVGPPYGPTYPYVVLTKVGRALSIKVQTERGYQWWAPNA